MSRYLRTLYTEKDRALVAEWLAKVPLGWRVEIKEPKRSLPQNDKFHAMLTDIATQLTWSDGKRYPPSDWKRYFMREVNKERYMPHEDGGYVPIGRSSTDLSKEEMAFMFDLLEAFGARHGVKFQEESNDRTQT
jgi:hypothetical protein